MRRWQTTLIMPADRIKPLVTAGFYGTGTVPPLTGLLVSLGGNTMDLVVGMDVTTSFLQEDPDGPISVASLGTFCAETEGFIGNYKTGAS